MSESNPELPLYNPFTFNHFNFEHCFFTGIPVQQGQDFVRLFPDWLIESFGLQNKSIQLLSGKKIPYSDLTLPASPLARQYGLDYLLRKASDLIPAGLQGVKWIKPEKLYQWLLLLWFGVLYQEIREAQANEEGNNAFLNQKDKLVRYHLLHYLLQGIVKKVEFENFDPGSVFILECHAYEGPQAFDFKVSINAMTIQLRTGELGIMACLLDHGVQMHHFKSYFERFDGQQLHPIQFDELYAKLSYKSWLMNHVFEYGVALPDEENDSLLISCRIDERHKDLPIFRDWDSEQYLSVLASYVSKYGIPASELKNEAGIVLTFLDDEEGNPVSMNEDGERIAPSV